MFSRVAHQAKSMVQPAPVASLTRPVSLTAARLPASFHSSAAQTPRSGVTAAFSQQLLSGALGIAVSRRWPREQDGWDGQRLISPAGQHARQAALDKPLSDETVGALRQWHAHKTGHGVPPELTSRMVRIGMVKAIDRPTEWALIDHGQGLVVGLRDLAIGPGDVVAEQEYDFPMLGVRLAMDGAKVFLTHSNAERTRMVDEELARYREGRTYPILKKGPDGKLAPSTADHSQAARHVARQLVAATGSAFDALPKDVGFKALISRCAFDVMDPRAVDASVRQAGRLLQPGGGLVFEFAHPASRMVPAEGGLSLRTTGLREIEDAVNAAGLGLRRLFVNFRFVDENGTGLIIDRCVLPDEDGRINLHKADAAAWSGWDEVAGQIEWRGRPLHVFVSGLFLKDGKGRG